jgi:hypothetical protein
MNARPLAGAGCSPINEAAGEVVCARREGERKEKSRIALADTARASFKMPYRPYRYGAIRAQKSRFSPGNSAVSGDTANPKRGLS